MVIIDIILGALILFGIIRGFFKGLFVEIASLLALVLGIYGAIHFSNYAATFLETRTEWAENNINITAFAITFVVIVLAIILAGKALTKLANFAMLGILNKLFGALFGGIKLALLLSILLIVFEKFNKTFIFTDEKTIEESLLYEPVKSIAPMIFPNIINENLLEEKSETDPTSEDNKPA